MVAQSSVEASLSISGTLAVCGVGVPGVESAALEAPPPLDPPPHAVSSAAATLVASSRDDPVFMVVQLLGRTMCRTVRSNGCSYAPLTRPSVCKGRQICGDFGEMREIPRAARNFARRAARAGLPEL
jgi:hypothetical protein